MVGKDTPRIELPFVTQKMKEFNHRRKFKVIHKLNICNNYILESYISSNGSYEVLKYFKTQGLSCGIN